MEEKKKEQQLKKSKKARKNDDRECILYRRAGSIFDNLSSDLFKDIMKPEDEKKSQILIDLEKKAAEGDSEALNNLGCMYYKGNDVEQDYKKAVLYFRKAADLGNTNAIKNLSMCYYWGNGVEIDMEKSVAYHRLAAEKGDAQAMKELGYMYKNSLGVPYDMEECIKWYKKAAELGNADAMAALGKIYYYGKGVQKDLQGAFTFFEAAAKQGNIEAKKHLAKMYEKGIGIQQDLEKAKFYCQEVFDAYRVEARSDKVNAYHILGTMYFNGVPLIGLKQDYGQAVIWFEKAARKGNVLAQISLGICYSQGLGVGQSYQKAFYWYNQAALRDHVIALINLFNCYYLGRGIEKDYVKAAEYVVKAAEKGFVEAYDTVGNLYLKGEGVEQNYQLAVKWYKKACEANVKSSFAALGNCYRNGWFVLKDESEAFKLYKKGAELDDLEGRVTLAECYIKGIGTGIDIKLAAKILEDVCREQEEYRKNIVTTFVKVKDQGLQYYNPLDSVYLQHYAKAYYLLAKIYAKGGDGVEKDPAESTRLLNIAEILGYKDDEESQEKVSELRKLIAEEAKQESIPACGQLNVVKISNNRHFGYYDFIYQREDDSSLTLEFGSEREKFFYLFAVLAAKVHVPLTVELFKSLIGYGNKKENNKLVSFVMDLGIDTKEVIMNKKTRDIKDKEIKTTMEGDQAHKWLVKFCFDDEYGAGTYSQTNSHIKKSLVAKNAFRDDVEKNLCMICSPPKGKNSFVTIGLSPDNIDVDPFFNDFMDAIQRVKEANTIE